MKSIIALSSLVIAANAFALDVRAPKVFFKAGAVTTAVSVLELCVNGDELQTLNEKPVFKHVKVGKEHDIAVVGYEVLSTARTFEKTIPAGKDGRNEKVITVTLPLDYSIEVYSDSRGDREGTFVRSFDFSIPACN